MFGVAAVAGLGIYAAVPDDQPEYLGDMPSMMERSEAVASPARPEPPDPPAPVAPRVDPPGPAGVEAPPVVGGAPGGRVPGPVTDAPRGYRGGGATGGGSEGPGAALFDLLEALAVDRALLCVGAETIERPEGTIDCLTGELLPEVPELPIDPELPVDPPVDLPVDDVVP